MAWQDAVSKYAWNGKNFPENKDRELDRMAAELQSAIQAEFQ